MQDSCSPNIPSDRFTIYMRISLALLLTAYVSDASDNTRSLLVNPHIKAGVVTWGGTRRSDTCSDWLVENIKSWLAGTVDQEESSLERRPATCSDSKPHAFTFLNQDEANEIAFGLLKKARRKKGELKSVPAFKERLRKAARELIEFLPPKTKDAAALLQSMFKTPLNPSLNYGRFCDPSASTALSSLKLFEPEDATFYDSSSKVGREYNYLFPFVIFVHRMFLCQAEITPEPVGAIPSLPNMPLLQYLNKYKWDGTGLGELPEVKPTASVVADSGVGMNLAPSVHDHEEAVPALDADAAGQAAPKVGDKLGDSSLPEDVPAVVPAVVPETPKDDIIAEQGTLQSQTSRLTRVASNVLKTWGMMRTAGIDAIDAVATVAMLADYADLVQQICYHLGNIATSSSDVDKMIEVTLARVDDYVLKEKPELLLLTSGDSVA